MYRERNIDSELNLTSKHEIVCLIYFRFDPDPQLTEILSKLWELDTNKCYPGVDYEIDLQGIYINVGSQYM